MVEHKGGAQGWRGPGAVGGEEGMGRVGCGAGCGRSGNSIGPLVICWCLESWETRCRAGASRRAQRHQQQQQQQRQPGTSLSVELTRRIT